ncbi:hypothetical protein SAMN05443575_2990 [Jatrophihabitans endophyticus]|uniref:Uncharacterized protein n=1 Tax=Jatrophihabitans endophyticus TaxID=1206085 RepID=A0A1M5P6N3_9ACTN|nr:hypothetical protein [Jatrophihabitans endophyticus]SHG97347.1 hypothetical protein SAMN05443575_2990 [Jatrophihabitans endophyticus]
MRRAWRSIARLPVFPRCVLIFSGGFFVAGLVVGLVVGLTAYPPTAWFAAAEIGIPALIVGALIGLVVGGAAELVSIRKADRHR